MHKDINTPNHSQSSAPDSQSAVTEVTQVTQQKAQDGQKRIVRSAKVRLGDLVADPIRTDDHQIAWITKRTCAPQESPVLQIVHDGRSYEPGFGNLPASNLILPSGPGRKRSVEELFNHIVNVMAKVFVAPDRDGALVMALFALASWNYDLHRHVCYLALVGLPGSAKSLGLRVLARLSYNSFVTSGSSTMPAILRTINSIRGTLLLDECQQRGADSSSDFHRMITEGFEADGSVVKCVAQKDDDFTSKIYSVFCPKIFGGRSIPMDEAIQRRILEIRLTYKKPNEVNVVPISDQSWELEATELRNDLLLYRQLRALGEVAAPGTSIVVPSQDSQLSLSEQQVFGWLIAECPNQTCLEALLKFIDRRKLEMESVRSLGFEHQVLLATYNELKNPGKVLLTRIVNQVESWGHQKPTSKSIAVELRNCGIEMGHSNKGNYVKAGKAQLQEVFSRLGYPAPENSLASLESLSKSDGDVNE